MLIYQPIIKNFSLRLFNKNVHILQLESKLAKIRISYSEIYMYTTITQKVFLDNPGKLLNAVENYLMKMCLRISR